MNGTTAAPASEPSSAMPVDRAAAVSAFSTRIGVLPLTSPEVIFTDTVISWPVGMLAAVNCAAPDDATLWADFAESYDTLNALERLLLRHPDAGVPLPPPQEKCG